MVKERVWGPRHRRSHRTSGGVLPRTPTGDGHHGQTGAQALEDLLGDRRLRQRGRHAQGLAAFSPESAAFVAGRIMPRRIEELARAREDFAFESTLAGRSAHRLLTGLVGVGYDVHIFYTLAALTRPGGGQGAPTRGGGRSRRARASHPAAREPAVLNEATWLEIRKRTEEVA